MTVEVLKKRACAAIDAAAPRLIALSANMHREVELAFEEHKAQGWLCAELEAAGFAVERGLGSLATAFRARETAARPGPTVAFLCEYDGLPVYGQSCGHNVVAAAGVGAAIGLKAVLGETGGRVVCLGTPGEEGGGGKNILHREGFFAGLDAMMLIYPGMDNIAHSRTLGATRAQVAYFGKAAHAAARPELGINALDALVQALSAIGLLRQQLPSEVRIHAIITKGGTLPQVVPDHTTALVTVRANDDAMNCNVGKDPCKENTKFKMTMVAVSPADEKKVKDAVTKVVLPLWKNTCNKVDPKCTETWNATVGKVRGYRID